MFHHRSCECGRSCAHRSPQMGTRSPQARGILGPDDVHRARDHHGTRTTADSAMSISILGAFHGHTRAQVRFFLACEAMTPSSGRAAGHGGHPTAAGCIDRWPWPRLGACPTLCVSFVMCGERERQGASRLDLCWNGKVRLSATDLADPVGARGQGSVASSDPNNRRERGGHFHSFIHGTSHGSSHQDTSTMTTTPAFRDHG